MPRIILSCTTTRKRIRFLFYMMESIKKQKTKPDVIYLNISSSSYLSDEGVSDLPGWIDTEIVRVNWVKNTGPYRKLIPAIEEAGDDDLVVTADDDIIYSENWLDSLINISFSNPEKIVCSRARRMKKNIIGRWKNYRMWEILHESCVGLDILPTGGAGAVYNKKLLDIDFLCDESFMDIAPTSDDLWFRMASLRKGVQVIVDPRIDSESIYLKHSEGLAEKNLKKTKNKLEKIYHHSLGDIQGWLGIPESENDRAWRRIVKYAGF